MKTLARPVSWHARLASYVGIALHLLTGVPYFFSRALAPPFAVVTLWVLWGALLALAIYWRERQPWFVLAVPFGSFALWIVVLTAGDQWLGWTA